MFNNLLPGDWTTLAGVIIAFFGVLVSAFFSRLLYRATKESTAAAQASANAAAASTRIAENLERKQREKDAAFREQILIPIQDQASKLANILNKFIMEGTTVTDKFNDQNLVKLNIDPRYLAELPNEERKLINDTWKNLDDLISNYWKESAGARHLIRLDSTDEQVNYRAAIENIFFAMNDIVKLK